MSQYSAYEPYEEQGNPYDPENQIKMYALRLERLIENEADFKEVKKSWKDFRMFYKRSRGNGGDTRFDELKKDYKNYKKYLEGKLDTNPIELKKGL